MKKATAYSSYQPLKSSVHKLQKAYQGIRSPLQNIRFNKIILILELSNIADNLTLQQRRSFGERVTTSCFEITMGSYDSSEICELVRVYLSQFEAIINKNTKWDFTATMDQLFYEVVTAKETNKTRTNIKEIFKNMGLKINIGTILKEVSFLDVRFNITNGRFHCVFVLFMLHTRLE